MSNFKPVLFCIFYPYRNWYQRYQLKEKYYIHTYTHTPIKTLYVCGASNITLTASNHNISA